MGLFTNTDGYNADVLFCLPLSAVPAIFQTAILGGFKPKAHDSRLKQFVTIRSRIV